VINKGSFINKEGKMFLSCKRYYHDTRGLTMIELMVALALGLIVTTVVFVYYSGINSNGAFQHEISKLEADLNSAADRMEIDIMNAGANPPPGYSGFSSYPLSASSTTIYSGTNSIFIQADLDKNHAYSGDNERVLYRWNRTKHTIERTYWDYINNVLPVTPYAILNNVTNFNITYYEPYNTSLVGGVQICPNDNSAYNCNGILYECNMNQKLADTTYFTSPTVVNDPTTWSHNTSQYRFASTTIAGRVDLVILDITVETSRNDPETGQPKEISLQKWIRLRNR
jgi:prepilin-type N-terminal cleavage/methylation domain-containing protein